jgi:hypothetical protein
MKAGEQQPVSQQQCSTTVVSSGDVTVHVCHHSSARRMFACEVAHTTAERTCKTGAQDLERESANVSVRDDEIGQGNADRTCKTGAHDLGQQEPHPSPYGLAW